MSLFAQRVDGFNFLYFTKGIKIQWLNVDYTEPPSVSAALLYSVSPHYRDA